MAKRKDVNEASEITEEMETVSEAQVTVQSDETSEINEVLENCKKLYLITDTPYVNAPTPDATVVGTLPAGKLCFVFDETDNFWKVDNYKYINKQWNVQVIND